VMIFSDGKNLFSPIDYGIFLLMILLSALVGLYFGFISKKKQDNRAEYLLGSKQMNFFPIAASLIASHISANSLLAIPSEVYSNGSEYLWSIISSCIVKY
jgi:solute carrier family 5 (sodium-coupled monocarboxylate transporter), member 8/12